MCIRDREITDTFGVTYDEVVAHCEPDMEFPGVTVTVPQRGDRAKLLDVARRNARQRRADALKHLERTDPEKRTMKTLERIKADFRLSELPRHIECFDNSNIQGTNPVASCVVFRDAKPSKKDYQMCIRDSVWWAPPPTPAATDASCSPSRPANSISAATKPPPTSAPTRE